MFCYRSAPRNIFFALFSPHTFFLLLFRPKSRVIWRWQVARHTVHVVPPVVCAKCGNFCENKALFTDLGIFKRKIYIFPPPDIFFPRYCNKTFFVLPNPLCWKQWNAFYPGTQFSLSMARVWLMFLHCDTVSRFDTKSETFKKLCASKSTPNQLQRHNTPIKSTMKKSILPLI